MKNKKSSTHSQKCKALAKPVSRRAFFGLTAATGTLSVLGTTKFGNSFVTAYADEVGNEFIEIVEVGRKQMPVIFVDALTGKVVCEKGMNVNLRTYDFPLRPYVDVKSTGEKGYVLADMSNLLDEYQREQIQDTYSGSVQVTAQGDGYQDYEDLHHIFVTGVPSLDDKTGVYVEVPIQKKVVNSPYASCLCLRGADIIAFDQEIGVSEENDTTYDMFIRVKNLPPYKKKIKLQLLADRKPIPIKPHEDAKPSEIWSLDEKTIETYSTTEGVAELYFVGN